MTAHDLAARLRDLRRYEGEKADRELLREAADALDRAEAASVEFDRRLDKAESQRDAALATVAKLTGLEFVARSLAEAVLRSVRPSTVTHEDCGCLTCQATALVAALDAGGAGR